jgi:hypothetical protein
MSGGTDFGKEKSHSLRFICCFAVAHWNAQANLKCDWAFKLVPRWHKCTNVFRDRAEEYLYISGINELRLTLT